MTKLKAHCILVFLLSLSASADAFRAPLEITSPSRLTASCSNRASSSSADIASSTSRIARPSSWLASAASTAATASASTLSSENVNTKVQQVQLASGTKAEVISCLPPRSSSSGTSSLLSLDFLSSIFGQEQADSTKTKSKSSYAKPTLAFLHGSFHASWCWQEKYMPYFASLGYPCVAFSLQGTGGTPAIPEGAKKVKVENHVKDLNAFLKGLSDNYSTPESGQLGLGLGENPEIVLIGHSFGGLTIMKWLEEFYEQSNTESNNGKDEINLSGVALLCSVPPSGNGPMTLRYLFRSFSDSWKITVGFAMKKAITDKELCRTLFFGGEDSSNGVKDADIERYQSYFERDTVATIDLTDLASKLPSLKVDKTSGKASFVDKMSFRPLVMGASDDFIVDKEGLEETANYMGLETPVVVESPHDVMLGNKWKNGAEVLLDWVRGL